MPRERGAALVIAVIVMGLLAALIIGLSTNTDIDLLVGRNTRILKQAFQWADSGLEIAQDMISISETEANNTSSDTFSFGSTATIYATTSGIIYNSTQTDVTTIQMYENNSAGDRLAAVDIRYLGAIINDGSSIIFASGYEGAGKGAGAGGTIARIYALNATGFSESNSMKKAAAIYRSAGN